MSEEVCVDQTTYLQMVLDSIAGAQSSICVEMYIFHDDPVGKQLLAALKQAAQNGIEIRVIVDGVGSPQWNEARLRELLDDNIAARIYHPVPNLARWWRWPTTTFNRLPQLLASINKRDHRKLVLIDGRSAIVGSCNITEISRDWREVAVRVSGPGVTNLQRSFELIWSRASHPSLPRPQRLRVNRSQQHSVEAPVRLNYTSRLRERLNANLAVRIERAKQRVWISTAYFVPSPAIIAALLIARHNRCDVKILLPSKSDVSAVEIVSRLFYSGLMRAGVGIYEYQPSMMHAKSLIIDDVALVGTSNLNHRSLYHDLEVDVMLSSVDSLSVLARQFEADLQKSRRMTPDYLSKRSVLEKLGAYIIYPFRRFI